MQMEIAIFYYDGKHRVTFGNTVDNLLLAEHKNLPMALLEASRRLRNAADSLSVAVNQLQEEDHGLPR